ncbi:MAG: O-antigen ligase family protein [Granulosicoccus sp.]
MSVANFRMPRVHIELGLITLGYVLSVMIDVYQGLTAAVYVVCVGFLKPKYIPYLLILLAVIQDGPGIHKVPRFAAFAVLTCFLIILLIVRTQHFIRLCKDVVAPRYLSVVFVALAAIVYALVVSFVVDAYADNAFASASRPWFLVGVTNLVMIVAAFLATLLLAEDKEVKTRLTTVALIALGYLLFVACVQMLTDPTVLHSDALRQSSAFRIGSQMSGSNTLGIARIASAMETPNAFCLSVAFLFMLIFIGTQDNKNSLLLPMCMMVTGLYVGFITLSKAQLAYFVIASLLCFLLARNYRFRLIGHLNIVAGLVLLLYFGNTLMDTFAEMFRIRNLTNTTRFVLWEAVMERMSAIDWMFGRGFSLWEELFADVYLYKTVTAPHNWLMYVLGTFGVLGIIVYVRIFLLLSQRYKQLRRNNSRVAQVAVMLVLFIFIKDLVTTSYVFNTSPLVYLTWLCLGMLCIPSTAHTGALTVASRTSRSSPARRSRQKANVEPDIAGVYAREAKPAATSDIEVAEDSSLDELYDLASEPEIAALLAQTGQHAPSVKPPIVQEAVVHRRLAMAADTERKLERGILPHDGAEFIVRKIRDLSVSGGTRNATNGSLFSPAALEKTLAALQPAISRESRLEIDYIDQNLTDNDSFKRLFTRWVSAGE